MRLRPAIGWAVFIGLSSIIAQILPSPLGTYYYLQGQYLSAKGEYESAAEAYNKSVSSDPGFARGHIELGTAYARIENFADAEKQYQQGRSKKNAEPATTEKDHWHIGKDRSHERTGYTDPGCCHHEK